MTCPRCGDPTAWTKCWECGWPETDADKPRVGSVGRRLSEDAEVIPGGTCPVHGALPGLGA